EYIYVIYIEAPCEKVFDALIDPEMNKDYWGGHCNLSDWKRGSAWQHVDYDDHAIVRVAGTVIENERPHRLVLTWAHPKDLGNPDKVSKVTFAIDEQFGSTQAHRDAQRTRRRGAARDQRRLAADPLQPENDAGDRPIAADDPPALEGRQLKTRRRVKESSCPGPNSST